MRIDRSKASIKKKGFRFKPFRPRQQDHLPLSLANLDPQLELLVFERNGERRALVLREMAYHHLCQGTLGGEPYLISF